MLLLKSLLDPLAALQNTRGNRTGDLVGRYLRKNGANLLNHLGHATYNQRLFKSSILCKLFKVVGPHWSARLEMCQWIRETLDKESIWDAARSTSLSRW